MAKVSKCLVVALFFLSIGFMGVSAVTSIAGTNWKALWEEKRHDGSRKNLKELVDSQTAELNSSRKELTELTQAITAAEAALAADLKAIAKREDALLAEQNDLNTKLIAKTKAVSEKGREVRTVQDVVGLRRERVITLREQLDQLRSLRMATESRRKLLTGLLIQTQALESSAKNRNDSLKKSGAVVPSAE